MPRKPAEQAGGGAANIATAMRNAEAGIRSFRHIVVMDPAITPHAARRPIRRRRVVRADPWVAVRGDGFRSLQKHPVLRGGVMPQRDIVVMGASAGGVDALKKTVEGLRPDVRASFFIVLHFPPFQKSHLPEILSRVGTLPAVHPNNGDLIQPRHIYVAPPDRHLLVRDGRIELWRGPKGSPQNNFYFSRLSEHVKYAVKRQDSKFYSVVTPKENHTRPAINPLFKSAAETYGPRVIGVILTGLLDDGTAGLIEITRKGGIGVVQDPDEAMFSSMPISALKRDHVDYSVKLSEMGKLLNTLLRDSEFRQIAGGSINPGDRYTLTDLTCPECRGPLSERQDGALTELRCRVGHIYSLESAIATHVETQERTLWSAVVALEEGAELFRKTAAQSEGSEAGRLINQAKTREANAKLIREMLEEFQ